MKLLEPCRWCGSAPFLVEKVQGESREYRLECHGTRETPCTSPDPDPWRRTKAGALFDWQQREPAGDDPPELAVARHVAPTEQLRIHCAGCGDFGCQGALPERMTAYLFGHGWAADGGKVTGWTCPRCVAVLAAAAEEVS